MEKPEFHGRGEMKKCGQLTEYAIVTREQNKLLLGNMAGDRIIPFIPHPESLPPYDLVATLTLSNNIAGKVPPIAG